MTDDGSMVLVVPNALSAPPYNSDRITTTNVLRGISYNNFDLLDSKKTTVIEPRFNDIS